MNLQLSVLDQTPLSEGMNAEEALLNTIILAKQLEQLHYKRFWVSEHHNATHLAGSSPEVLIAYLAAVTKKIRLGSGGIMLNHYSPYKVAENFRLLSGLAPNRIDLGVGRAPGGMPISSIALNHGKRFNASNYEEILQELLYYLNDALPETHELYGLKATPIVDSIPPVWMLGSSPASSVTAANLGFPYVFARFINGEDSGEQMSMYLERFQPSSFHEKPQNILAVTVVCAQTNEEADYLATSIDLSFIMSSQGMKMTGIPSPEKASAYSYNSYEHKYIKENRQKMVVGNPESVKKQLLQLSEQFQTNEIMLVTNIYDFAKKMNSFRLVAEAFSS